MVLLLVLTTEPKRDVANVQPNNVGNIVADENTIVLDNLKLDEKANYIVSRLADIYESNLNYFNSLSSEDLKLHVVQLSSDSDNPIKMMKQPMYKVI